MPDPKRILCEYCATPNPWGEETCLACGGPLTYPKADPTPRVTVVAAPPAAKRPPVVEARKAAEKADDLYFMALGTYAIAWRTAGEAVAIALTGLVLGFVGGVTGAFFSGVVGPLLVGLVVGLMRKQFYVALLSAPAGLLVGLGLGAATWALGSGPRVMAYTGLVFALIGAAVGGKRNLPFKRRNWWEKARPFLGALGGLGFGLLGTLIGWGVAAGAQALMRLAGV